MGETPSPLSASSTLAVTLTFPTGINSKILYNGLFSLVICRFEVKVEGLPKPEIQWYINGNPVYPSDNTKIEDFEDGTSVLTIPEAKPEEHLIEIMCEAVNEAGASSCVSYFGKTEDEVHLILILLLFPINCARSCFKMLNSKFASKSLLNL